MSFDLKSIPEGSKFFDWEDKPVFVTPSGDAFIAVPSGAEPCNKSDVRAKAGPCSREAFDDLFNDWSDSYATTKSPTTESSSLTRLRNMARVAGPDDPIYSSGLTMTSVPKSRLSTLISENKMAYIIFVADNFHDYDDDEDVSEHSRVASAELAITECESIVNKSLKHLAKPGMTADEVFNAYRSFGNSPYIRSIDGSDPVKFSASEYAKKHSGEFVVQVPVEPDSEFVKKVLNAKAAGPDHPIYTGGLQMTSIRKPKE